MGIRAAACAWLWLALAAPACGDPAVSAGAAEGSELSGRVVHVDDGDSLRLERHDGEVVRVRLAEIDAPERDQAFADEARALLSSLVDGKSVRVAVQDTDRYGRSVGRVFVGDTDVCAELVRRGAVWVYRRYLRDRSLIALEDEARSARRGLWAGDAPVEPWEWRHDPEKRGAAGSREPGCGERKRCSEMRSCDEALRQLERCGASGIDGDGDGIPCERLCRGYTPED